MNSEQWRTIIILLLVFPFAGRTLIQHLVFFPEPEKEQIEPELAHLYEKAKPKLDELAKQMGY